MSSFELWFSDDEEEDDVENAQQMRVERRRLRDMINPLDLPQDS